MSALPETESVKYVASEILPHVHSFGDIEFYTNHGIRHSENVQAYIKKFCALCEISGKPLNEPETAILDCACWLHDIGCVRSRENHARHSVEIIRLLCTKGLLNLGAIKTHIEFVVLAHSSNGIKIEAVENLRPVSGFEDNVRLQFICALFKLADECDITRLRAPRTLYEILKTRNIPTMSDHWWLELDNVISLELLPNEGVIRIHMEDHRDTDILDSLKLTLENLGDILEKNDFTCTKLEEMYHPSANLEED